MKLSISPAQASIALFAVDSAPLQGLKVADLTKIRKLHEALTVDGVEHGKLSPDREKTFEVEVAEDAEPMLKALWANVDLGYFSRHPMMLDVLEGLDKQINGTT